MAQPKVSVLIEEHYDETEFNRFNEFFPRNGYTVEYLSYLWGQPTLSFKGNDHNSNVTVHKCVTGADPLEYAGIILIGGYATDRLRYEENPRKGKPSRAPAVEFLRKSVAAMDKGRLCIGTICHSLWLFCADPALLKGRRVTCAHNIVCDVLNAGGIVEFNGDATRDIFIHNKLITGKHPGVVDAFMQVFLEQLAALKVNA
ncbi:MAG: thiamine biosynthesis protein ThiJ [Elusimicrobia bacterium]|nr:thiamine biosynthesis protein ThiJ [Elusimicrobiota bacterium]